MKNWNKLTVQQKLFCINNAEIGINYFNTIDSILSKTEKKINKKDFILLRKAGVINGVGPAYFPNWLRIIISIFFKEVRCEFHDINYFIWGTEEDKIYSDFWLLKYSFKSIINDLEKTISKFRFTNKISLDLILFIIYFILGSIYILSKSVPLIIVFFCFLMVLGFGRKAFLYTNYNVWKI